jgi:hypothetical protein
MPDAIKVFIAGSRRLSRLDRAVTERLEAIIGSGHRVLVGDASGVDAAVQKYFAKRLYPQVTVFCTQGRCRNHFGGFPIQAVEPPPGVRSGFDFFAAKDMAMAHAATHGLMLWDAESRGTFTNVLNLVRLGKPVVVYVSTDHTFASIRTPVDLRGLLGKAEAETRRRFEREVAALAQADRTDVPVSLF